MIEDLEFYAHYHLNKNRPLFDDITKEIAKEFKTNKKTIISGKRTGKIVICRNFVIHFIYKFLKPKIKNENLIYKVLAQYLERNHLTIRYHQLNALHLIKNDPEYIELNIILNLKFQTNDII
tara:strand:- start:828 stop:1193 length:366 start_codon:yes stop_codon:yes gene_type:complete